MTLYFHEEVPVTLCALHEHVYISQRILRLVMCHCFASASKWVSAPSVLVPSDGVFGRFDLAALRGCHSLNVWVFVCMLIQTQSHQQFSPYLKAGSSWSSSTA
jgi:hypothetical protein